MLRPAFRLVSAVFALCALCAVPAAAMLTATDEQALLHFTVLGPDGKPLAGANVSLEGNDPAHNFSGNTDDAGQVDLLAAEGDSYFVVWNSPDGPQKLEQKIPVARAAGAQEGSFKVQFKGAPKAAPSPTSVLLDVNVTNFDGRSIPRAKIVLRGRKSGREFTGTTDGSGKAHIRLHGVTKGKGRLRIYLNLSQPENNSYVEVEEYYDVEVLEAEKWSYSMSVHDQFTLPAQDYSMSGKFSVAGSLDENDIPHWKVLEASPVSRSGGGSFNTMGDFINSDSREDGVVLGFDVNGILNRAEGAVDANLGVIAEAFQFLATGQAQTTNSKNVVTSLMTTLEEGSWPFRFDIRMMEQFAGSSVSGSDVYALEAAGKELEAKRMQEQQEQPKADKKKPKKKSAFREIREGLKALKELDNFEMPDLTPKKNSTETSADSPYSPSQEQAKAAQIAYIKEHHCIVVPDLTQLLSPHFGNWIKEGERSGPGGDLSWQVLSGTLNLSKEN